MRLREDFNVVEDKFNDFKSFFKVDQEFFFIF